MVKLIFLLLVVAAPALAQVQGSSGEQDQQTQQQTDKGQAVKQPPPPLYPKHRRGIYKNALGLPVIDATPQSPPLETDDPGVPDKGEYEINFTGDTDFTKDLRTFDFLLVDANYGILPKVFGHELPTQVKFEFPVACAQVPGDPMRAGVGTAEFGLKFNFYNNESIGRYISFYPQIAFAVPGSDAARKDLAEPGQTVILPLLVQQEFKYLTIVANAAINQPLHDPARDTTGALSAGLGRAITRHVAAMAELRFNSALDLKSERLVVANFGLMRRLGDELTLYGNFGRSIFTDENDGHIYVGIGMKFLLTPKDRN